MTDGKKYMLWVVTKLYAESDDVQPGFLLGQKRPCLATGINMSGTKISFFIGQYSKWPH